jgi:hypothetical protein
MLVKCNQGDFNFEIPENFKKVGIKISGGIDSALLFYLLSKYKKTERPDIKIFPITGIVRTRPWQYIKATDIKNTVASLLDIDKNTFYEEHYVFHMETKTIRSAQGEHLKRLYVEEMIDCHVWGVTANPPSDVAECMIPGRDLKRDPLPNGQPHPTWIVTSYNPFSNIDKQGVASIYHSEEVFDKIFPLTRSCEIDNVYVYNTPCKRMKCWWCQERKWGFGTYG